MADSYRPDRHRSRSPGERRSYYDSDKPDDARAGRRQGRYDDDYGRDRPLGEHGGRGRDPPRRHLNYEEDGAYDEYSNDGDAFYARSEVQLPQYHFYTRSDDLRFDPQKQRYFDGSYVPQMPAMAAAATGEKDHAPDGKPGRFLLVRGLKQNVNESVFAKGMAKFHRDEDDETPGGATPTSLKRVFIIRTRGASHSMGFGFAEYDNNQDAEAAVHKGLLLKKSKKCTIGSNDVEISFAHLGVFPPASVGKMEHDEKFTFVLRPTAPERHKYHDERYYASELVVNSGKSQAPSALSTADSEGEKKGMKRGVKRSLESPDSRAKKAKGTTPAMPDLLQRWNKTSKELHSEERATTNAASSVPASGANALTTAPTASGEELSDQQTFVSQNKGVWLCNLCNAQFKDTDHVLRHLKDSPKHASALEYEEKVAQAHQRMKTRGVAPENTFKLPAAKPAEPTLQYRDRAAERRVEEGKTGRPLKFSLKGAAARKPGNASGSSSDNEASKPSYGIGMKMLQKEGWSEGQSLGSGGTGGITAPIDQSMYAAGVGLGHESSKKGDAAEEAARMTKDDRAGYSEMAKEGVRKRYAQME